MVLAAGVAGAAPMTTFSAVPLPTWMVSEPESVVPADAETGSMYPLGFCVFSPPKSSCCSRDRVGDPKSGSGVPELVLPSCVFSALISEL